MSKSGRPTRTSCSILNMKVGSSFFRHVKPWNPVPLPKKGISKKKQLSAICGNSIGGQILTFSSCPMPVSGILDNSLLRSVLGSQYQEFFHRPHLPLHYWKAKVLFALRTSLYHQWNSHFSIMSLWSFAMFPEQSADPRMLLAIWCDRFAFQSLGCNFLAWKLTNANS